MDLKCGFFNAVNNDRKYTAEDMNYPYNRIISNGIVCDNVDSSGFQVLPSFGLTIIIKKGFGLFGGKWGELERDMSFPFITPHVTLDKIYSIVVVCNKSSSTRKVFINGKSGDPATNPVPPTLTRNDSVMEYRLANIYVKANATEITQADITDTRASSDCGFVTNLLQNSNISSTFAGWQAQFERWLADNSIEVEKLTTQLDNEFDTWSNAKKEEYNQFLSEKESEYEQFITEKEQAIEQTQTEFNSWTAEKESSYDQWFNSLTQDLSIGNVGFLTYDSVHTAVNDGETEISIGINEFSSRNDVLSVFINGLKLIPEIDYTLNGFDSIVLTKSIDSGTIVSFFLLKTVLTSEYETTLSEMQKLQQRCNDLEKMILTGVTGDQEIEALWEQIGEGNNENLPMPADEIEALWEQIGEGDTEKLNELETRIEDLEEAVSTGGTASNSENFTYVVDSDQALADWANNVEGNDYTSVLIRKGTWTSTVGVNLTTTGTKVIKGEAGNKVIFIQIDNHDEYGLDSRNNYCEIHDVNVEFRDSSNFFERSLYAFAGFSSVFNCTATVIVSHNTSVKAFGFFMCKNIVNSKAVIKSESTGEVLGGSGFFECENITNCTSDCTGYGDKTLPLCGFYTSNNIVNSSAVVKGIDKVSVFYNCNFITNCVGDGSLTDDDGGECFGFKGCTNIHNSQGSGKVTNEYSEGYGFRDCKGVVSCKAKAKCTTSVFSKCYASNVLTSEYTCADTPAGGFNDTTNPSA